MTAQTHSHVIASQKSLPDSAVPQEEALSLEGLLGEQGSVRIGMDLQSLKGRKTGLGVYTQELLRAFSIEPPKDFQFRFYSRERNEDLNTPQRWFWENVELPLRALRDKVRILHTPAFAPPAIKCAKLVVTVHDLIGMLFPNSLRWPSALYWGKWLPWTLYKADAILADSEHTKKDLIRHLGIQKKKIRVIYLSGHEAFSSAISQASIGEVKKIYGIREKYFLFVGTLEPRKNLRRVIEAFGKFRRQHMTDERYQLVIVGSKAYGHGEFFRSLAGPCGVTLEDVIFTGYVNHADLNALYSGAEIFVYPSLYEGFGIPILEAMASGTPVLASTQTSVPEVTGEAALLVDPRDMTQLVQAMADLSKDPLLRKQLIAKGFERIKRFSWKETARQTLEVYRSLL